MTSLRLETEDSLVGMRHEVRRLARAQGFSLVQETKVVTAASEIARNALDHAGGGVAHIEPIEEGGQSGVRVIIEDDGPGIADVEEAFRDGYSTGTGFGFGLGGARRLSDEFELDSKPGRGTRVSMIRWK